MPRNLFNTGGYECPFCNTIMRDNIEELTKHREEGGECDRRMAAMKQNEESSGGQAPEDPPEVATKEDPEDEVTTRLLGEKDLTSTASALLRARAKAKGSAGE